MAICTLLLLCDEKRTCARCGFVLRALPMDIRESAVYPTLTYVADPYYLEDAQVFDPPPPSPPHHSKLLLLQCIYSCAQLVLYSTVSLW